jgi:hypothetical protein
MVSFTPQTLYPRGWNSLPVSIDLLGLVMDDAGFTSITSLKFFFFSSLGLSTLFFSFLSYVFIVKVPSVGNFDH